MYTVNAFTKKRPYEVELAEVNLEVIQKSVNLLSEKDKQVLGIVQKTKDWGLKKEVSWLDGSRQLIDPVYAKTCKLSKQMNETMTRLNMRQEELGLKKKQS